MVLFSAFLAHLLTFAGPQQIKNRAPPFLLKKKHHPKTAQGWPGLRCSSIFDGIFADAFYENVETAETS